MKTAFALAILALCFAPTPCFALWDVLTVGKEEAKQLGMEVRGTKAGPEHVSVELEFGTEKALKGFSRVELRLQDGDNPLVTAALQEDRTKPGRVVVGFTAARSQLDKLTLWVMVPGGAGGSAYEIKPGEFVE